MPSYYLRFVGSDMRTLLPPVPICTRRATFGTTRPPRTTALSGRSLETGLRPTRLGVKRAAKTVVKQANGLGMGLFDFLLGVRGVSVPHPALTVQKSQT